MAAWVPQEVVARFMSATLKGDTAVVAQLPDANHILPDEGVPSPVERVLVHTYGGEMVIAAPIGGPITQATMVWNLTGWEPSASRLSLNGLMKAVKTVLIGGDMRGRTHLFTMAEDSQSYAIDCDVNLRDPASPMGLDQSTATTWAPVRERYRVSVRPRL